MDNLTNKVNNSYYFKGPVKLLKKVQKGCLTSNFILESGKERYFLKQYIDDLPRIKSTHKAKQFFYNKGIPVVLPIKTKKGKTYFIHNRKVYAIFPFCEGQQFKRTKLSRKALISAGKLLAEIHLLSKNKIVVKLVGRGFTWNKGYSLLKLNEVKRIINKKSKKSLLDKKALKFLELKIKLIEENNLQCEDFKLGVKHIIHADYHESNMFFDRAGEVSHLFDWEMVSVGPRIFDVIKSMEFFCFYGKFKKENFKKARLFLATYNQIYPIDKLEFMQGIQARFLGNMHCTWILEEHYLKNNNRINKFFINQDRSIRYFSKHMDKFISKIANYF